MEHTPGGWERTREWIAPLVLWRLVQLLFVVLALYLVPFNQAEWDVAFHADPGREPQMIDAYASWDAQHYLHLAREGYTAGEMSSAFYPLWPALIRLASLGSGSIPVALLLANGLGVLGLLLVHRLLTLKWSADEADTGLWFLLAAPGAFWLGLPYSEALFLVFLAGSLLALQSGRPVLAGAIAFFAPLTRPTGVFLALPLLWTAWEDREQRTRALGAATLPLLGYAAYFLWMYAATGDATEGFSAQRVYMNQPSIARLFDPAGMVQAFFDVRAPHTKMYSALDRGLFVAYLALLPAMWRVDRRWFWYALAAGVIPAITGHYMGFTRYSLLVLPLWFALTRVTAPTEHRHLRFVLLAGLFGLQHMLLVAHVTWSWGS